MNKIISMLPPALSGQIRRQKGFTLVEILIVIAIVGGLLAAILATTGTATQKREVRRAVQDITDISGAMSGFFGHSRIAPTAGTLFPTPARLEGVAAAALEHMQNPSDTDTILTQFGTDITITSKVSTSGEYFWPNYWITYTGLRSETCGPLLGSLSGPIAVQVTPVGTGVTAWTVADDHRTEALTSAASVEAFCASEAGSDETYAVHAVFRI